MKHFLLGLFIIIGLSNIAFAAPTEITAKVDGVILQAGATNPKVVARVNKDTKMKLLGEERAFWNVEYNGKSVYVSKSDTLEGSSLDSWTDEELTNPETIPVLTFTTKQEKFDLLKEVIKRYAKIYNLDEYVVLGCIRIESNFNLETVSVGDCVGLMQLHPGYAENWGYDNGRLMEMVYNINFGCKELSAYYNGNGIDEKSGYHNYNNALAAYNTGSGKHEAGLRYASLCINAGNAFKRQNFLYTNEVSDIH